MKATREGAATRPLTQRRPILVRELSRVYAQNSMRPRLLIASLVLALSGSNSGATAMCAAFCMSSALEGSALAHHHNMGSQQRPTTAAHHFQPQYRQANCSECPPGSGSNLKDKTDCSRLLQIQALKEGSVSLNTPGGVAQVHALDTPTQALAAAGNDDRFLPLKARYKLTSFSPVSAPLRI